jgi:mono/diheme cytochrome c family protein
MSNSKLTMRRDTHPRTSHASHWAWTLVLIFVCGPISATAEVAGDPSAGRELANAWCGDCHGLERGQTDIEKNAPSFGAIAANRAVTPLALRAFFHTPHHRMPDLSLKHDEIDDLIAYILSLRDH